ncbi:MAG TPA: hypothetical protein VGK67_26195 [Myxococcales bacterium]|jgi:hypothetical protein
MPRLLARLLLLLPLAACSSNALPQILDDVAVKSACGGSKLQPPLGGASDALWIACDGDKSFALHDGKSTFKKVDVPSSVPAEQPRVSADRSLYVLTRDPQEPTTTNPRLLIRLLPDGTTQDRTAEVNPTRAEELRLVGTGGTVVVQRGSNVYLVDKDQITALPAPMDGNYRILGMLPVLGEERHDRFFLHVAVGAGSPGTPDDVKLFFWEGSWRPALLDDPTELLRFNGFPRVFVPVGSSGELFGIANRQGAQDRIVPILLARWSGGVLRASEIKLSVEAGYFKPQQLYVRANTQVVVLGTESEGNEEIVNRLAYYAFTGEDFRLRNAFQEIQNCSQQTCDRSISEPLFLVDGAVQYVITDATGAFQVMVGKL